MRTLIKFFEGDSLKDVPLIPLEDAIQTILEDGQVHMTVEEHKSLMDGDQDGHESLKTGVPDALKFAREHLSDHLSLGRRYDMDADEIAAIHIYTQQTRLYKVINKLLEEQDDAAIQPFLKYIKLLLTALYKLPEIEVTVIRGVKHRMELLTGGNVYEEGSKVQWWRFSSSTRSVGVLQSFLEEQDDGSLFLVNVKTSGVAISDFSAYDMEDEILLIPGTTYLVHGTVVLHDAEVTRSADGSQVRTQVMMAQLKETGEASLLGYTRAAFKEQHGGLRTSCSPFAAAMALFVAAVAVAVAASSFAVKSSERGWPLSAIHASTPISFNVAVAAVVVAVAAACAACAAASKKGFKLPPALSFPICDSRDRFLEMVKLTMTFKEEKETVKTSKYCSEKLSGPILLLGEYCANCKLMWKGLCAFCTLTILGLFFLNLMLQTLDEDPYRPRKDPDFLGRLFVWCCVVVPFVLCYFRSRYRGLWDFRRWNRRLNLEQALLNGDREE